MKDKANTPFFRGKLNGEVLSEVHGSATERNKRKDTLFAIMSNDKASDNAKIQAKKEMDQLLDHENQTMDRQINLSFTKFGKMLTAVFVLVFIGLLAYILIMDKEVDIESDKGFQAIIGLTVGLCTFILAIIAASFKKAKVDVAKSIKELK